MIEKALKIGGVMPVLYSFFDEAGALRMDGFEHQIEHCIANGASGIVLFGFVTQFYRLSFEEKKEIARLAARQLGGRGTLGITVMEPALDGQMELVRLAEEVGADWVILQPPLGPPSQPALWMELVCRVAAETELPVAIQNATIAGTTFSNDQLLALKQRQPNICLCKAETESSDVARFAREQGRDFRVITGNWGVEYPFFLENGAHGLIPAPNFVPEQVTIHAAAENGDRDTIYRLHRDILPLMQFIRERPPPEGQIILGKYAYQRRTGYAAGGNRLPGPQEIDPAIRRHLDWLCGKLW